MLVLRFGHDVVLALIGICFILSPSFSAAAVIEPESLEGETRESIHANPFGSLMKKTGAHLEWPDDVIYIGVAGSLDMSLIYDESDADKLTIGLPSDLMEDDGDIQESIVLPAFKSEGPGFALRSIDIKRALTGITRFKLADSDMDQVEQMELYGCPHMRDESIDFDLATFREKEMGVICGVDEVPRLLYGWYGDESEKEFDIPGCERKKDAAGFQFSSRESDAVMGTMILAVKFSGATSSEVSPGFDLTFRDDLRWTVEHLTIESKFIGVSKGGVASGKSMWHYRGRNSFRILGYSVEMGPRGKSMQINRNAFGSEAPMLSAIPEGRRFVEADDKGNSYYAAYIKPGQHFSVECSYNVGDGDKISVGDPDTEDVCRIILMVSTWHQDERVARNHFVELEGDVASKDTTRPKSPRFDIRRIKTVNLPVEDHELTKLNKVNTGMGILGLEVMPNGIDIAITTTRTQLDRKVNLKLKPTNLFETSGYKGVNFRDGSLVFEVNERSGGPHGISVGPDGAIWGTDFSQHQIQKFNAEGQLMKEIGTKFKAGNGRKKFSLPSDIIVMADGNVLVADSHFHELPSKNRNLLNGRLSLLDSNGKFKEAFGEEKDLFGLHAMALDETTGNLLVTVPAKEECLIYDVRTKKLKKRLNFEEIGQPHDVVFVEGNFFVRVQYLPFGEYLVQVSGDLFEFSTVTTRRFDMGKSEYVPKPHGLTATTDDDHIFFFFGYSDPNSKSGVSQVPIYFIKIPFTDDPIIEEEMPQLFYWVHKTLAREVAEISPYGFGVFVLIFVYIGFFRKTKPATKSRKGGKAKTRQAKTQQNV